MGAKQIFKKRINNTTGLFFIFLAIAIGTCYGVYTVMHKDLPKLTLLGDNPLIIEQGLLYSDPGYSVIYKDGQDITWETMVTGTIDSQQIGTYTLYFDVEVRYGNKAKQ